MLGRQDAQSSLADVALWSGNNKPLIDAKSFHGRFAEVRGEIIRDDDFAHWFVARKGRPSIPPSVVAGAFLLSLREGASDREAEQRMRYDLRWKWALGLDVDDHGCDHSSLCVFRARLVAHKEEGKLFADIVQRAVDVGLLPKRALQVMDSSPMLGAGAVQDTYKLLRTALHKLVKCHENDLPADVKPRLRRYVKTGKADIDWNDREARQRELTQLVHDAELAVEALPRDGDRPVAAAARELLERVATQDVEDDGQGGKKIRKGVARDRVVSTNDPDMRHGHKSSAGRWDGYKKHVSVEPTSELITAIEVTGANVSDGPMALELLVQQKAANDLAPAEVAVDMAYGAAELRAQALAQGEGTTLVTRAAARAASPVFPKSAFRIDCESGTVTCPAGKTASFTFQPGHAVDARFAAADCAGCPLASQCLSKTARRVVGIHPYENQLQLARQRRERDDFAAVIGQRPTVERKQEHWNRKGGRESRYFGMAKTRMQAFWSAAVVNLERMMVLSDQITGGLVVSAAGAT